MAQHSFCCSFAASILVFVGNPEENRSQKNVNRFTGSGTHGTPRREGGRASVGVAFVPAIQSYSQGSDPPPELGPCACFPNTQSAAVVLACLALGGTVGGSRVPSRHLWIGPSLKPRHTRPGLSLS